MNSRIETLKQRILSAQPELCVERARLVTQSYQKTEGQPMAVRRARALEYVLSQMSIFILDGELIVGQQAEKYRSTPIFPEMSVDWLEEELDSFQTRKQDPFVTPESIKEELRREVFPYWKGRTLKDQVFGELPKETMAARLSGVFTIGLHEEGGLGHVLLDFPSMLARGLNHILRKAEQRLRNLDLANPSDYGQMNFLKAVAIACRATIGFASRYGQLAEEMAQSHADPTRRDELLHISQVCKRVPANPARNFWEALQALWFIELVPQIESNGPAVSVGRFDQYMYSFYVKDIAEGKLTKEKAQELLDCLWIKFNEPIKIYKMEDAAIHAGFPMNHNLTIGGQNPEGGDATNELSYMCLAAHEHIHFIQPNFSARIHVTTPKEFLLKVSQLVGTGGGLPQILNDEIIIPALLARGIPIHQARDYGLIGCNEPSVIGAWGRTNGGYFNLTKILELALNDGTDMITGKRIGPKTGKATRFISFEQLMDAYRKQLAYFVKHSVIENNVIDEIHANLNPELVISALVPECIERGRNVSEGGARFNWTGPLGVGLANTADSLAALKKVVFEDGEADMKQVVRALEVNFTGFEDLRQELLAAPKYGNDDDYPDSLARLVADMFFDELEKYRTPRGGTFVPSLIPVASNVPLGWVTAATPEGRFAKTPLADGVSPTHGSDLNGPTAVLKSVAKIDHLRATNGIIFNQRFDPAIFRKDEGLSKFTSLIRTFCDLKIQHIQCNVISSDTLRDAQKSPENYRGLVVRVAGYSAFFSELGRDVQNDIIERTEQSL